MAYQPIQMPGGGAPQADFYGFAKDQVARQDNLRQQAMSNWLSVWKQTREDAAEERRMKILEEQQRAAMEREDWNKKKEFVSIQSEIMPMLANPATAEMAKARLAALGISLEQQQVTPPPTPTQQVGQDIQAGKVVDPFVQEARKPVPPQPVQPPPPPQQAVDFLSGVVDPLDAVIADNVTQGKYYGPRDEWERGVGIPRSGFGDFAKKFGFKESDLTKSRNAVMAPVQTPAAAEAIAKEVAARAQREDYDRTMAEQARGFFRNPDGEGPALDPYKAAMDEYKSQLREYANRQEQAPRNEYRMRGLGIDSTISEDAVQQGVDQQRRTDAQRFGDAFSTITQHHPRGAEAAQWIPVLQAEIQSGMPLKNANDALNRFLSTGDLDALRAEKIRWEMSPEHQKQLDRRAVAGRMVVNPVARETLDLADKRQLEASITALIDRQGYKKGYGEAVGAARGLANLGHTGNSVLDINALAQQAKSANGAGVLTDQDFTRFTRIGDAFQRLEQLWDTKWLGTLTDDVKRQLADAMRETGQQRVRELAQLRQNAIALGTGRDGNTHPDLPPLLNAYFPEQGGAGGVTGGGERPSDRLPGKAGGRQSAPKDAAGRNLKETSKKMRARKTAAEVFAEMYPGSKP